MKQQLKHLNRLILLTLLAFVAVRTWGLEVTEGYFVFNLDSEKMEASLVNFTNKDAVSVAIPNSVRGQYKVTKIIGAFNGYYKLTSVTFPKSLESIENSFEDCTGLTRLVLPKGLKSISGFSGCTGLRSINFPEGVASISGFSGCTGLRSINFPEGMDSISGFSGCTGLTSINLPQRLTFIGGFSGCTGLTSINLPQGLTSIKRWAFRYCTGLTNVTLSEGVTTIGSYAFEECSNLTTLTLNNRETTFESHVFEYTKLDTINSRSNISSSSSRDAFVPGSRPPSYFKLSYIKLFGDTIASNNFFRVYIQKNATVEIGKDVRAIGNRAFMGCSNLTNLNLPQGLTAIGDSAFMGCSNLTNLNLPQGLTAIGNSTFEGCSSLTELSLPQGLTTIGNSAFKKCNNLTSMTFPKELASIGISCFEGCIKLNRFTVANGNRHLTAPDGVLLDYAKNTLIAYPAAKEDIAYEVPASVKNIVASAFYDCKNLARLSLPQALTTIGSWAFAYCSGLEMLTLPQGLTSIGKGAFSNSSIKRFYFLSKKAVDISYYGNAALYVPPSVVTGFKDKNPYISIMPIPTAKITMGGNGYTTFYISDESFVIPDGLKAGIVIETTGSKKPGIDWRYQSGDYVPASVPLLFKGPKGSYERYKLPVLALSADTAGLGAQRLYGLDKASLTEAPYAACFYRLKWSDDLMHLGFYWDAKDGGLFTTEDNEAYLALPRSRYAGVVGFALDDLSDLTAITQPEITDPADAAQPQVIYTLDGRRVNATSTQGLVKGIYIVNGKKVLVR